MTTTTTPRGYILQDWEENGYHDSDFWATAWDVDEGRFVAWVHGTTRAFIARGLGAQAADRAYAGLKETMPDDEVARLRAHAYRATIHSLIANAPRGVRTPAVGERAVFLAPYRPRKRKPDRDGVMTPDVEVGDAGNVIWVGPGYGRHSPDRIGVSLDKGGTVFVSALKVGLEGAAEDLGRLRSLARDVASREPRSIAWTFRRGTRARDNEPVPAWAEQEGEDG